MSLTNWPMGSQFFLGEEVLFHQEKDKLALGFVVEHNPNTQNYLVRFGDRSEKWAPLESIEKINCPQKLPVYLESKRREDSFKAIRGGGRGTRGRPRSNGVQRSLSHDGGRGISRPWDQEAEGKTLRPQQGRPRTSTQGKQPGRPRAGRPRGLVNGQPVDQNGESIDDEDDDDDDDDEDFVAFRGNNGHLENSDSNNDEDYVPASLPASKRGRKRKSINSVPMIKYQGPIPPPPPAEHTIESRKSLPYDFDSLKWDDNHFKNEQGRYCYCGQSGFWYKKMIQCQKCYQWFHQECIKFPKKSLLYGDRFYKFVCTLCCGNSEESLERLDLNWVQALQLVLFNLTINNKKKHHDLENAIVPFIQRNWSSLQGSIIKPSQVDGRYLSRIMVQRPSLFRSGSANKRTFWGLVNVSPPVVPAHYGLSGSSSASISHLDKFIDNNRGSQGSKNQHTSLLPRKRGRPPKKGLQNGFDSNSLQSKGNSLNELIPYPPNFKGPNNPFFRLASKPSTEEEPPAAKKTKLVEEEPATVSVSRPKMKGKRRRKGSKTVPVIILGRRWIAGGIRQQNLVIKKPTDSPNIATAAIYEKYNGVQCREEADLILEHLLRPHEEEMESGRPKVGVASPQDLETEEPLQCKDNTESSDVLAKLVQSQHDVEPRKMICGRGEELLSPQHKF